MLLPHNVSFLTINDANEWFSNQQTASVLLRKKIMSAIQGKDHLEIPSTFLYMSSKEADLKLLEDKKELEIISSFQVISAAEGSLKYDFELKLRAPLKSALTKNFSNIYSNKSSSMRYIDVDRDILEIWKLHYNSDDLTEYIGQFRTLLKFRHWVAHGRFWEPNTLGRVIANYHPTAVSKEIQDLFSHLASLPDGFNCE
ncbi:MAG: hypothetical protein WC635_04200 [Bacteriovorax sp.]